MSVTSLSNTRKAQAEDRRPAVSPAPSGPSFRERMVQTTAAVQGPSIHLRMPNEDTVFSGSHRGRDGTMQELYAEYTAGSTPGDPIVRVTGTSDSGPFDFTCHVKDIDPSSASYAELAALFGHLEEAGASRGGPDGRVLPTGLEAGDITEKRDYLSMIDRHRHDSHFGGASRAQAAELLALYRPYASGAPGAAAPDHRLFLKDRLLSGLSEFRSSLLERMREAKEDQEEQEAWDKLMEHLDAWIESLREEADVRRIARAHAALAALQADAGADRPDLGSYLLGRMEALIA